MKGFLPLIIQFFTVVLFLFILFLPHEVKGLPLAKVLATMGAVSSFLQVVLIRQTSSCTDEGMGLKKDDKLE